MGHSTQEPRKQSKRTDAQNASMWLFFTLLADELNNGGFSIQKVLTNYKVELDWDKNSVHDIIWVPIQKALLNKSSTTQLNKHEEITAVYEHINRFVAQMGIHIPFPVDEERQKEKQYLGKRYDTNYPTDYKEPLL